MRVVSSQCVLVVQPLASPIILASVAGGLVCLVSVSWTGRVGFSTLPVLLDQHFGRYCCFCGWWFVVEALNR